MTKKWLIAVYGNKNVYIEFVTTLSIIMETLGYKTSIKFFSTPDVIDAEKQNILFITGKKEISSKINVINCGCKIFYQMEQNYRFKDFVELLPKFDSTFHLFKNHFKIDNVSKNKHLCPCGYHENFNVVKNHKNIEENIDIFSFGGFSKLRRKFVKNHKNVTFGTKTFSIERDIKILGSKINLVLKAKGNYSFPQLHGMLVLANKKFLMCDTMVDYYPFKPNVHFISTKDYSKFDYYLNNTKERMDFAENAFNEVKKIKMIDYIEQALNNL